MWQVRPALQLECATRIAVLQVTFGVALTMLFPSRPQLLRDKDASEVDTLAGAAETVVGSAMTGSAMAATAVNFTTRLRTLFPQFLVLRQTGSLE